jgi:hypothetical protein
MIVHFPMNRENILGVKLQLVNEEKDLNKQKFGEMALNRVNPEFRPHFCIDDVNDFKSFIKPEDT